MAKKESKELKSYLFCSCLAKVALKSDLVNILSHHSCHRDRETQKPMNTFRATPSLQSARPWTNLQTQNVQANRSIRNSIS